MWSVRSLSQAITFPEGRRTEAYGGLIELVSTGSAALSHSLPDRSKADLLSRAGNLLGWHSASYLEGGEGTAAG